MGYCNVSYTIQTTVLYYLLVVVPKSLEVRGRLGIAAQSHKKYVFLSCQRHSICALFELTAEVLVIPHCVAQSGY